MTLGGMIILGALGSLLAAAALWAVRKLVPPMRRAATFKRALVDEVLEHHLQTDPSGRLLLGFLAVRLGTLGMSIANLIISSAGFAIFLLLKPPFSGIPVGFFVFMFLHATYVSTASLAHIQWAYTKAIRVIETRRLTGAGV